MAHTQTKMRNIIMLAIDIVLLLITFVTGIDSYDPSAKLIGIIPSPTGSLITSSSASELLDDQLVVTSYSLESLRRNSADMPIQVELFSQKGINRKCNISTISPSMITSKRLSEKTILISLGYGFPMKLLLVNIINCKSTFALDRELISSPFSHPITSGNFKDERFIVVTAGKEHCEGHDWCRLHFDPMFRKLEPLDFDLSTDQIDDLQMVTSFDGYLIVVSLIDDDGTYIVRLYDLAANRTGPLYQELFFIIGYKTIGNDHLSTRWYEMTSSGLSFCYHKRREDEGLNVVHCLRFREDGSLMFNRTVVYHDAARNYQAKTIPNGLILFSHKSYCYSRMKEDECSIVRVAVITRDYETIDCEGCSSNSNLVGNEIIQIKHRRYDVHCQPFLVLDYQIKVDQIDGSFEVKYLCHGNEFTYGVFYI